MSRLANGEETPHVVASGVSREEVWEHPKTGETPIKLAIRPLKSVRWDETYHAHDRATL